MGVYECIYSRNAGFSIYMRLVRENCNSHGAAQGARALALAEF
jgi:hypothetical protein